MTYQQMLQQLIKKWTVETDGLRAEARRLERSDLSRHATSVAMLEVRAQTIDRCIVELQTLGETRSNQGS